MSIFGLTYVLLETTTFFLLGFGIIRPDLKFFINGFEVSNKPMAVYDTIYGYHPFPGERRYVSVFDGILEMDHLIYANNQGWYSHKSYSFKKRKGIKRYMVLGDSFSSGVVVPTTWVDLAQDIIVKKGQDSLEFYNFSFDGSGIQNWYRIFFAELIPRYEFDGVIIASSFERGGVPDFDRKCIIAQSQKDATYITSIDITKEQLPKEFPFQKAIPITGVFSDENVEFFKKQYTSNERTEFKFRCKKPDLHFLSIFYGVSDGLYKYKSFSKNFAAYNKPFETYFSLAEKPYRMAYFDQRYEYGFMLKEIINYCQCNKKEIKLVGIPDLEHSLEYIEGKECIYRNELKFLSEHYAIPYFDGFEIFSGKDSSFISTCFYRHDLHWNEKGVALFAKEFTNSFFFR